MTPTNVALAFRNLPPGIRISAFDNQLGLKYFFVAPRTCGGGSPPGVRLAARIGDGWAAEDDAFERLLPRYRDALAEDGKTLDDAWVALGFGGGKTGVDALSGSPWVESPRETWARYAEAGVDEAIVTARTPNDIDALVAAVDRW